MRAWITFFLLCFLTLPLDAQTDSIPKQKIDEFVVKADPVPVQIFAIQPIQKMDKENLKRITSFQLSDVIKHFAGTVVKDYGGVGGMKTVSVRGLGSQHTGVLYNGVALSDCQTGQIDVGKLPMDFIESITLSNGPSRYIFTSAREHSFGAVMNVVSENPIFQAKEKTKYNAIIGFGSFGLVNGALKINHRINPKIFKKWDAVCSIQGNYTQLKGDYPFTLFFGGANDSTSQEIRSNADVKAVVAEGLLLMSHKVRKEVFKAQLFYYQSERGLPGAVLYYNTTSDQRLWDANVFAQTKYIRFFNKNWGYSNALKMNHSYIRYLDPSYMNEEGKLDNRYIQNEWYMSNNISYLGTLFDFSIAHDLFYNDLVANTPGFSYPNRWSSLTSFSTEMHYKWLKWSANILHTYVVNNVLTGVSAPNNNKWSPTIGLSIKPNSKKEFYVRAFFKNIFRLPTFNDLYYREIGNVNLKPENTYQYSLGSTYYTESKNKKWSFSGTLDLYFNLIHDKIVAIPSRNLFVWSMINFGKVYTYGSDLTVQSNYQINKNIQMALMGSYSFQKAIDMTDPESKTYRNQLPYTPLHSGSVGLTFLSKWITITYSSIISGSRYVLGQNIPQNLLSGYIDHSVSLGKEFTFRKSNDVSPFKLGVKLEMINITNQQYQIVKNYPMPGRNYRLKLQFQF